MHLGRGCTWGVGALRERVFLGCGCTWGKGVLVGKVHLERLHLGEGGV